MNKIIAGGVVQAVERLLSQYKAPSSNPRTTNKDYKLQLWDNPNLDTKQSIFLIPKAMQNMQDYFSFFA